MSERLHTIEQPLTHVEKAVAKFNALDFDARVNAYKECRDRNVSVLQGRLRRHGISADLSLSDASLEDLVARDYGFDSFQHLDNLLKMRYQSFESAQRAVIAAAYVGNEVSVAQLLGLHEQLLNESPAAALSLGMVNASDWIESGAANERLEPMGWHPITYACCSRVCVDIDGSETVRYLVRQLLDARAVPSVGLYESDTVRGFLTALGGAVGYRCDDELVKLLLDAGADIHDGLTLYEGSAMWYAVVQNDIDSMAYLLAADPPLWHLCHALPHAIDLEHYEIVDQLLGAGADPNWDKTAKSYVGNSLHEAIFVGSPLTVGKKLVDANANLNQRNGGGLTPISAATALNRTDYVEMLSELGADANECSSLDRWVGACFAHDRARATHLSHSLPSTNEWQFEDHLWLCLAARDNDLLTSTLLLEGGMNPNAIDYDGNSALHLAAISGNSSMCELLVRAGAAIDVTNFEGCLPIDFAHAELANSEQLLDLLGNNSVELPNLHLTLSEQDAFEDAASAIPNGDLVTLRSICDDRPKFAHARSARPHRCTLLNYVGVNGFEGERQVTPANILEVMDYLIDELGCDPRAWSYTYRGEPGNDTVGLLTSSGHPRERGLTLAMTHRLAKGGAEVSPGWQMLIAMHGCRNEGTLDEYLRRADLSSRTAIESFIEAGNLGELDLVESMLRAGMDPNVTLWADVRAIHNAAINGDLGLVELLLNAGADPTLRDSQFNGTAAGWADAGGHAELTKLLVEKQKEMESD